MNFLKLGAPKSFVIGIWGFIVAKLTLFSVFVLRPASMVEFLSEDKWVEAFSPEDWAWQREERGPKTTLIAGGLGKKIIHLSLFRAQDQR